ncbi:eukaryotic aspartyl protease [Colletotrichum tofieldiae]|uniref:Eukaryotic aspartyl protease n=1 Tax=Colletotrichum tofieldiae TaxID=708197 RepID=A0A161Y740_9PEZI|nr:eukaryotic aspartyl protease [Colletotrichum tofieldiae]GKT59814.1 eukaryotic aspartyl protease [Colletotrichum tofieldiae]GKT78609.1 eukaryotic aspartyl protease [Colletotrichum tofieldiae]GKT85990.1 eukaryotic aspartyl protease [Colletotrichum tofieldiae]
MESTSLRSLVLYGLLATFADASPVEKRANIQKRGHFLVPRVPNENFKGHDGTRQLVKAYRKFSMPMPAGLLEAMAAQAAKNPEPVNAEGFKALSAGATNQSAAPGQPGTGLVTATPIRNDVEYVSPIKIGGQEVNVDFDSGSSDLWVFTSMLDAQSQTGHQLYDPSKSQNAKMLQGQQFSIRYGDGSGAQGVVGTDVVDIGGAVVQEQAIEMATAVSQQFVEDTANNGLLGLAFSKLNTVKPTAQKTFFDNVMPSLAEPVFTADLRKKTVGAYEFGRIDTSKFTGQMAWIPINTTSGFWQFSSEKFAVGNGQVQAGTAGGQAIADTGTTLILANPTMVQAYYQQVQGAKQDQTVGGVTFPCNAQLPDLMMDIGGVYMARVKGSDINFAQVDQQTCFGGLQATTSKLQIYGDILFKSQFVAFNGGNMSLGMAEHVVNSQQAGAAPATGAPGAAA